MAVWISTLVLVLAPHEGFAKKKLDPQNSHQKFFSRQTNFFLENPTLALLLVYVLFSTRVTQPRATGDDELDIISHKNYLDCFQN